MARQKRTTTERARRLRRDMPDSEGLLWRHVRNRRLGGLKFRRQHPIGPFFVDLYCGEYRLAVEIDGASHDDEEAQAYDVSRDEFLRAKGIKVTRFTGTQVLSGLEQVLERIYETATRKELDWSHVKRKKKGHS